MTQWSVRIEMSRRWECQAECLTRIALQMVEVGWLCEWDLVGVRCQQGAALIWTAGQIPRQDFQPGEAP